MVAWIMLNPSTATAEQDDPTIRRCIAFSKAWGHGGLVVVNLFSLRATDPRSLVERYLENDPDAEFDDQWKAVERETANRRVIAAWGVHGRLYHRDRTVLRMLRGWGIHLECLGLNLDGSPKHPLYVRGNIKLVEFGRKG